jgi:hypothetical protein
MAKRKRTKGPTNVHKTLHRKLQIEQGEPLSEIGDELQCFRMVRISCSTGGICRVIIT